LPFTCLLLAAVAFAAGCSTSTGKSELSLVDASGNHPADFVTTHPAFATPDTSACVPCHGDNLQGGISGVSCFTASFNGQACHAAGPTPANHQPVATWVNAHQGEAAALRPTFAGCNAAVCHGATLQGANGPSCFSPNFAGFLCHSGGPPPDFHPANWFVDHRAFSLANGTASCATAACHGATLHADPPDATGPSCFRAAWGALACHAGGPGSGGANHAVPFFDNTHFQATPATFTSGCLTCHDVSAPTVKSGPVCQTCHVAASPLTALNCTSCHATPPSGGAPAGAVYPNIPGAHVTHIALNSAGSPVSCDTCHNGLGSGTLAHYNRANARPGSDAQRVPPGDAAFPGTYDAQSGASSFDNGAVLSCSNVSCHGGQATPNWQTGTLNVISQCTNCHVFGPSLGNPQYNSPYSGEHNINTPTFPGAHQTCTNCHNTTTLAADHFTTLADNTISPAVAAATIGGGATAIITWTAGAGTSGTCNAACHPGDRTW
jgi:predicted CxxxxCH...CXXCH cytochrome family protein